MKLITSLVILVVFVVASAAAQRTRCVQRVRRPTCTGVSDVGSACAEARPRQMWYYNQANRTCIAMQHLGCGGNSNRWCTRRACERKCNRPTTTT